MHWLNLGFIFVKFFDGIQRLVLLEKQMEDRDDEVRYVNLMITDV